LLLLLLLLLILFKGLFLLNLVSPFALTVMDDKLLPLCASEPLAVEFILKFTRRHFGDARRTSCHSLMSTNDSVSSDGAMHSIDHDELSSQRQQQSGQQHQHSSAPDEGGVRRAQSSSSLMSGATTEDTVSQYSFASSVPTHQKLIVRSEVRGVMLDAIHTRVAERSGEEQHVAQVEPEDAASTGGADQSINLAADDSSHHAIQSSDVPGHEPVVAPVVTEHEGALVSPLHRINSAGVVPEAEEEHSEHLLVTSSLLVTTSSVTSGPTPRKLAATVSISTPPSTSFLMTGHHLGAAVVSPTASRHAARLPPIEPTDDLLNASDEIAVRRRIEQLSLDLNVRLSSHTPSRNATFSSAGSGANSTLSQHRTRGGGGGVPTSSASSLVIPSSGAPLPSVASGVDRRKMRDGLIAMSTEARKEDVRTILCKREIKLAEVLDEQVVLQKKLGTLTSDVNALADQKLSLEHLRRNHHAEMNRLRSEVNILNKELNGLKWEEGRLHQEITDLTNSLQRFRHKRSTEEVKRLQELNSVSYELMTIEKAIEQETTSYKDEWQRLRRELRVIQEEIVSFSPQEWLAAAVAAGMKKKIAEAEFGGDRQKAHQYATATLAAAGRRKTVANIVSDRSALDAFLQGAL
jgi:predicted  nucleic acid-binding Zn-ribbon protein